MKLCFTVATPDTHDDKMLALRGGMSGNFQFLRQLGYQAAELMVRDVALLSAKEISQMARDEGLVIPAVSTGQLRKEDGLELCSPDPAKRRASIDRTKEVLDFAAEFGAQVNIGTLRGSLPDRALAVESLRELLSHSSRIAIEPQSKAVINWLHTIADAKELQRECEGLSILFDFYHMELEENNVAEALEAARRDVSWVQVSDSNRRAPGWGDWDFAGYLGLLRGAEYQGYISVECLPWPTAREAAQQAMKHLSAIEMAS